MGFDFEEQARSEGFHLIAGVDEVGRGCLAGPVVAAACILDPKLPVPAGLNDSKKLSEKRREEIASALRETAIAYSVAEISADEIDRINILEATKRAMLLAVNSLQPNADYVLIDAIKLQALTIPQKSIIKGDSISYSIAAASVIAKTYRDELMTQYDAEFPKYGFAGHKGYGSEKHFAAIREHGPCPLHRLSFRGVLPPVTPSEGDPF
ncbi:MAG: ribonuclease HII [Acidobacteriota bacterium]|nr:MAG: ribonuclease HII [Acidobacteriota bacterium]